MSPCNHNNPQMGMACCPAAAVCVDTLRAAAAPPPEGSRRPAAPMWGQVLDMLQERDCVGRELEVGCVVHHAIL